MVGCPTRKKTGESTMAWKRPVIREICIGMEINAYLPGEL
jgi:coenzyme PQQ precursor peptide PqqA